MKTALSGSIPKSEMDTRGQAMRDMEVELSHLRSIKEELSRVNEKWTLRELEVNKLKHELRLAQKDIESYNKSVIYV